MIDFSQSRTAHSRPNVIGVNAQTRIEANLGYLPNTFGLCKPLELHVMGHPARNSVHHSHLIPPLGY